MENLVAYQFNDQTIMINFYNAPQEQEVTPEEMVEHTYSKKKYRRWNAADLSYLKKDNPTIPKNDLECLSVELTLNELLGPKKYEEVVQSVASGQPKLSRMEAQTIWILVDLLKDKPEYMMSYLYDNGIFPGLLFKEKSFSNPDGLALFSDTIKQYPRWSVELALSSLSRVEYYPESLRDKLDEWLLNQLRNVNLKKHVNSDEFIEDLACYLHYSTNSKHGVYQLICSKMDAFCEKDQHFLWNQILGQQANDEKKHKAVLSFLSTNHSVATNKVFLSQLCAHVPQEFLENILGNASDEAKKNYFKLLKEQKLNLMRVKICDPNTHRKNFLAWDLYHREKIQQDEIIRFVQNYDVAKRSVPAKRSFLFQDKELLNWDVFMAGCQKMKSSPMRVLMWIDSFKKTPGFALALAHNWEALPTEIRQNNNIQLSMDNHFDLFYQLACRGNTSMLNEIMKSMKNDYPEFIRRLTRKSKNGDTCLHQLCHQSKKGILKLLEDLPKEKQEALLNQKNDMGKSPLDMCSDDFCRFLNQKNFVRQVCETNQAENKTQENTEAKVITESKTTKTVKKLIWRPQFKSKRYMDDCEKFKNQPNVIKGARREIAKLRSMPWTDLQLRMGQDIKRSFKSRLCAADFAADGNAYRVGYILQDGVIGVLFIMTHQQYNKELQVNGSLDMMAKNVRQQISTQTIAQRNGGRN